MEMLSGNDPGSEPASKRPRAGLSPSCLHDEVKRLVAEGQLEAAAELCEAQPEEWSERWFLRGFVHDVCHEHEAVSLCMHRALQLDPRRAEAWLFLAETSYRAGDFETTFLAFDRVRELQPEGQAAEQAQADQSLLARNLRCVLAPRNVWSLEVAKSFLQEEKIARVQTTEPRVFDEVFESELLNLLRRSVDDLCTWRTKSPRKLCTFWLSRSAKPKTAAEVAGRLLLQLLGEDPEDYEGIEWWCRNQCARMGAHFHYDTAISGCVSEGTGAAAPVAPHLQRPSWSSVLYLGDIGGPTMVLDQVAAADGCDVPSVPSRAYICTSAANRWLAFPGDLKHGAVSFGLKEPQPNQPRNVILYNYWKRGLRPALPSCGEPTFEDYLPVSSISPTSIHLLAPALVEDLLQRGLRKAKELSSQLLQTSEEMSQSVLVEGIPFGLPLPAQGVLSDREGSGFLTLDWIMATCGSLCSPSALVTLEFLQIF
eukprot:s839_g36.t1